MADGPPFLEGSLRRHVKGTHDSPIATAGLGLQQIFIFPLLLPITDQPCSQPGLRGMTRTFIPEGHKWARAYQEGPEQITWMPLTTLTMIRVYQSCQDGICSSWLLRPWHKESPVPRWQPQLTVPWNPCFVSQGKSDRIFRIRVFKPREPELQGWNEHIPYMRHRNGICIPFQDCHTNGHKLGGLQQQKCVLSEFLRIAV